MQPKSPSFPLHTGCHLGSWWQSTAKLETKSHWGKRAEEEKTYIFHQFSFIKRVTTSLFSSSDMDAFEVPLHCKLISEITQENLNDETLIVKKFNINIDQSIYQSLVQLWPNSGVLSIFILSIWVLLNILRTKLLERIVKKTHNTLEVISKHKGFPSQVSFHLRVTSKTQLSLKYTYFSYTEFFFISQK